MKPSENTNRLMLVTLLCGVFQTYNQELSHAIVEQINLVHKRIDNLTLYADLLKKCEVEIDKQYWLSVLRSFATIWIICTPFRLQSRLKTLELVVKALFLIDDNTAIQLYLYSPRVDYEEVLSSHIKKLSTAVMNPVPDWKQFKTLCHNVGLKGICVDILCYHVSNLATGSRFSRKARTIYFLYSINMIKRGLGRLPFKKVVMELAGTVDQLTTPQNETNRYFKCIDFATEMILAHTNWNKKNLCKFLESKMSVPFFSSTYENSKSYGGGKARLFNMELLNEEELAEDYVLIWTAPDITGYENRCRFAALVEPNKVRPITIQSEVYQQAAIPMKEFLLKSWKNVPFGTMEDEWKDKILEKFRFSPQHIVSSVDYSAATNMMRPEATYYALDKYLEFMKDHWDKNSIIPYREFADFQRQCVRMRTFDLDKSIEICGKDENPTNKIRYNNLRYFMKNQHKIQVEEEFVTQGKAKKTKKHYIEQDNGQLMGNPLSFVLLCTINLASLIGSFMPDTEIDRYDTFLDYFGDLPEDGQQRVNDFLDHFLINGDDSVYRYPKAAPSIPVRQKAIAKSFGLVVNDLKTWVSDEYFSLNSCIFLFNTDINSITPISEVGYLNQAILYNNNIKNMNGIDQSNIASCTEYVFTHAEHNDDELPIFGEHVLNVAYGNTRLAEEFFVYHKIIREIDYTRCYGTGSGSLNFNILFPFLKQPKEMYERGKIIISDELIQAKEWFTAEGYQRSLMLETQDVFGELFNNNIFVYDDNGISSSDLKLSLSDMLHHEYKITHFSRVVETINNKYQPLDITQVVNDKVVSISLKELSDLKLISCKTVWFKGINNYYFSYSVKDIWNKLLFAKGYFPKPQQTKFVEIERKNTAREQIMSFKDTYLVRTIKDIRGMYKINPGFLQEEEDDILDVYHTYNLSSDYWQYLYCLSTLHPDIFNDIQLRNLNLIVQHFIFDNLYGMMMNMLANNIFL